ncbi:hypothetical protein [Streptomyces avermitilis]|uniref:hypothetical protein n=1 Tax=Streptomyces avermitilis TaxID=33903 RepID=UPI0036832796
MPPQPPMPPAVPKKTLSPLAAGLLGLAVGAGIVGGAWAVTASQGPDKPQTFTLKGEFTLLEDAVDLDSGCAGTGGYDDIKEGAAVTVYGAKGDVVATGYLGNSKSPNYGTCVFDVAVSDVPKGEKFYKVEVSHRGTVQMNAKEAEAGEFGASLG